MPISRKRKRTNGGRRKRSKRNKTGTKRKPKGTLRSRPRRNITNMGNIFPAFANVIMPYRHFQSVTQPNNTVAVGPNFRLGSIFGPNFLVPGAQPMGHDTYAGIYGRYRVKKLHITGTITLRSQSNDTDCYVFAQSDVFGQITNPLFGDKPFRKVIESGNYRMWNIRSQAGAAHYGDQIRKVNLTLDATGTVKRNYGSADNKNGWASLQANPVYDDTLGGTAEPVIKFWVTDGESRPAGSVVVIFDLMLRYHCTLASPTLLAVS